MNAMHTPAASELHTHARYLADIGLAVFPVAPGGKQPAVKDGLHEGTTDLTQIDEWWTSRPNLNIGVATGQPSGLVVVDVDDPAKFEKQELQLPETLMSTTGKGYHLWFLPPNGRDLRNTVKPDYGFDIRGTGGYVVAPPSYHPDGGRYRWGEPWTDPAPFPQSILTLLDEKPKDKGGNPVVVPIGGERARKFGQTVLEQEITRVLDAIEGTRNHTLFEAACNIFEVVKGGYIEPSAARGQLTAAAQTAGLPLGEIEHALESAWARVEPRHPQDGPIEPASTTVPPDAGSLPVPQPSDAVEVKRRHTDDGEVRGAGTGLRYLDLSDLDNLPRLRFLLEGILPEGQTWLAGKPGAGKSFVALDWAATYAAITGREVVYYVGEGLAGMPGRITAWRRAHPHVDIRSMKVVAGTPQLAQGAGPIAADWEEQGLHPALVVIDTFARAAVGVDENSAQDVGRTIHTMGQLHDRFGSSFVILHHTNARGTTRGSSAIDGAAESIWHVAEVEGDPNSYRLSCQKMKDGQRPMPTDGHRVQHGPSVAVSPSVLDQLGYGQAR